MKCDVCGNQAVRFVVHLWDESEGSPVKSVVTKSLRKSNQVADKMNRQKPSAVYWVGMEALCYRDLYQA